MVRLDQALLQMCNKQRFLELIHDFVVFDAGVRKGPRHNQYFGVKAAQARIAKREGGISHLSPHSRPRLHPQMRRAL